MFPLAIIVTRSQHFLSVYVDVAFVELAHSTAYYSRRRELVYDSCPKETSRSALQQVQRRATSSSTMFARHEMLN